MGGRKEMLHAQMPNAQQAGGTSAMSFAPALPPAH
jgi:hypothetical protein